MNLMAVNATILRRCGQQLAAQALRRSDIMGVGTADRTAGVKRRPFAASEAAPADPLVRLLRFAVSAPKNMSRCAGHAVP
jgi:hypothetical protein